MASISWGKFNRLITIELNLSPLERTDCFVFLKMFRVELDRLIEQSPIIPMNVRKEFLKVFRNTDRVAKPDVLNVLQHTKIFYDTESRLKKMAVEAAMTLGHKRKVVAQLVTDQLDHKMRDASIQAAREAAVAFFAEREAQEKEKQAQARKKVTYNLVQQEKENRRQDILQLQKNAVVTELKKKLEQTARPVEDVVVAIPNAIQEKEVQEETDVEEGNIPEMTGFVTPISEEVEEIAEATEVVVEIAPAPPVPEENTEKE